MLEQGARPYSAGEKMVLTARKNDIYYSLIENMSGKSILPGAEDNLQALRASKYTLAVILQSYQEKAVFEKIGLGRYFDGKIGPDFCHKGWRFAGAAGEIGLEPNQVLALIGTAFLQDKAQEESISFVALNQAKENIVKECGIIQLYAPTLEEIKMIDVLSSLTIKEEKE